MKYLVKVPEISYIIYQVDCETPEEAIQKVNNKQGQLISFFRSYQPIEPYEVSLKESKHEK